MILLNKVQFYVLVFFALAGIVDLMFFIYVMRRVRVVRKEGDGTE